MSRRLATVVLACLAATVTAAEKKPLPKELPPFGPDEPLPVSAIDTSTLPNGLTVWIVPRAGFPRVTVRLTVRGGLAADPKGLEGISELLADTLKEGTANRSARRIAEELQAAGAEIAAGASDDAVQVTIDALSTGTDGVLAVLADVAQNAAFPAPEVELAKSNAQQGLDVQEATPEYQGDRAFARAVFGEHPYHVVGTTRAMLGAVTRAVLKAEFARRFRPEGALLVVAGDVEAAPVRATVERAFGRWRGAGEPPRSTPASPKAGGRRLFVVDRPGSVQSLILVGRPVPTSSEPDYYPTLVASTICAGSFGSRLVENIREDKGYSYSPGGNLEARQKAGVLRLRADVRNEVTGASLLEMLYELDRMAATTPTEEELRNAKRYQGGLYLLRNQIQGALVRTLATNWVNGLPPQALGEFVSKVNAVSAEDVRRAGGSYFASGTETVVVVGEAADVRKQIAPFGEVLTAQP